MPLMVMPRNWTVRSTSGHTIRFHKDVPTDVPDNMFVIDKCSNFGAEFVNEADTPVLVDEARDSDPKELPQTAAERTKRIEDLLCQMRDNQSMHRDHFTSGNRPRVQYVRDALGFDLRSEEVTELWKKVTKLAPGFED